MSVNLANKKYEGFVNFISAVTGVNVENIRPISMADICSINMTLRSLGTAKNGRSYAKVAELRFGLDGQGKRTLRAIADAYGVTPSAIMNQLAVIIREMRVWPGYNTFISLTTEKSLKLDIMDMNSIKTLKLSVRSRNALWINGIQTVSVLITKKDCDLLRFKNFGHKSLQEIDAALAHRGLERRERYCHKINR